MQAWRIAARGHALDLSGLGAAKLGGRWNEVNVPALYAGLSVEIAALEKFVHLSGLAPLDLVLVRLELPEDHRLYVEAHASELPSNWRLTPPPSATRTFGTDFLRRGEKLGLILPSAVIPEAENLLLNPRHPEMRSVRARIIRSFAFDHRMFGR